MESDRRVKGIGLVVFWACLWIFSGCAGPQGPGEVLLLDSGKNTIHLKADNFAFEPSKIEVRGTGGIVIQVENVSDTEHNLTVKDINGGKMESVDLPPNTTKVLEIDLTEPGIYEFYCDKTFHKTMGMKGTIQVHP